METSSVFRTCGNDEGEVMKVVEEDEAKDDDNDLQCQEMLTK